VKHCVRDHRQGQEPAELYVPEKNYLLKVILEILLQYSVSITALIIVSVVPIDPGPICYTILACAYEIQTNAGQYDSICSDSQAALKALQSAKITSPLVQHCQKARNDISTQHTVELFWVSEFWGMRKLNSQQAHKRWCCQKFVGPELTLRVFR
jgi:hypothetical protein